MLKQSASLGRTCNGGGGGPREDGWETEGDEGNSCSRSIWVESLKKLLQCWDFALAVQSVGGTEDGWSSA